MEREVFMQSIVVKKPTHMLRNRYRDEHLKDLQRLGYNRLTLMPLIKLENKAHKMATDECNGTANYSDVKWTKIEHQVRALFAPKYLNGFIINSDPRGYTLKIDESIVRLENIKLYKDWGGYGILSPDFN